MCLALYHHTIGMMFSFMQKIEFPLFLSFHFVWIISLYDKQILELYVIPFSGLNKNNFYINCNRIFYLVTW
jgi:hypothetical protein